MYQRIFDKPIEVDNVSEITINHFSPFVLSKLLVNGVQQNDLIQSVYSTSSTKTVIMLKHPITGTVKVYGPAIFYATPSITLMKDTLEQDLNTAGTTLTWDGHESDEDALAFTGTTDITVLKDGRYELAYLFNHVNTSNGRRTIMGEVHVNGIPIKRTRTYAYSRNTVDKNATNHMAGVEVSLSQGDVLTLVSSKAGSSGTAPCELGTAWFKVKRVY